MENVRPIFQVGRLTRKSFPLGPQSIPLGTCLSTHLATRHLPLDSQYHPRPAASGNIESQEASASLLGSSRGSCLGGWISVLRERISWSLLPFMKGRLQSRIMTILIPKQYFEFRTVNMKKVIYRCNRNESILITIKCQIFVIIAMLHNKQILKA